MDDISLNKNLKETEFSESTHRGICSISPFLSHMQSVVLIYIRELAFYLFELNSLGYNNENMKNDFIESFGALITNFEYSQESFHKVISTLYIDLYQTKEFYKVLCQKNNVSPKFTKSKMKITQQFSVSDAIKQGKKVFDKINASLNEEKRKRFDLMIVILKSIYIYMVELQELNKDIDTYYKALLTAIGPVDAKTVSVKQIDEMIEIYVKLDNELMKQVYEARKEMFGEFIETEISFSNKPSKAILVAGSNIKDLELILKATEGKEIDVYTHGQMIAGHTYEKLKAYPHLAGHYGKGLDYTLYDFAYFPGPIFLTKLSSYKIESIYRGNIFTSDAIAPEGIIKIRDNNFEPLIQAALGEEGFTKTIENESLKMGFNEEKFIKDVNNIAQKIEKNEIKNLFTIGVGNGTISQSQYFQEFLNLLEEDDFAISASYVHNRENVLHSNVDYVFPLLYKALDIISAKKSLSDLDPKINFTRCEPHTIPNLFYIKHLGINNVYFWGCSPNLFNPALIEFTQEILNIKKYTTPQNDLKEMKKDK